jgi:predicted enzyme related to lactoylglutathione lyase
MSQQEDVSPAERVTGIGGVFFYAADPAALMAWYRQHLGVVADPDGAVVFRWPAGQDAARPGSTVWVPFPADTTYFAPSTKPFMINFRVANLDRMLAQLRAAGVPVDDHVEEMLYGRFGWCMDPEGNRVELWEPAEGQ